MTDHASDERPDPADAAPASNPKKVRLSRLQSVDLELYRMVIEDVRGVIPTLRRNKEYRSKHLVSEAMWAGTDKTAHALIGRCIAHAVARGLLPLRFVGCPRCNVKRYMLD